MGGSDGRGEVEKRLRVARGLYPCLDPTPKAAPVVPPPTLLPALDHSQHPRQLQPLLPVGRPLGDRLCLGLWPRPLWALRGVHRVPHDLLEEEPPQVPAAQPREGARAWLGGCGARRDAWAVLGRARRGRDGMHCALVASVAGGAGEDAPSSADEHAPRSQGPHEGPE